MKCVTMLAGVALVALAGCARQAETTQHTYVAPARYVQPAAAEMSKEAAASDKRSAEMSATPKRSLEPMDCAYPWGGQLCHFPDRTGHSDEFLFTSGRNGSVDVSAATIQRLSVRCDYKAKAFFVDDALRTRQEIFGACMRAEILTN